jgi:hypothetical protein
MLQVVAGPLLHQYATLAFQPGPDLQWFCMTPAEATAYNNGLLAKISAANAALFGPSPQTPNRPFLLQNTVDWLCCDVDAMKLALAAPEAQVQSSMGAAAHAVMSALQSAAVVAAASARDDDAAASRAAQAVAAATQSAVQHALQLQALGVGAAPTDSSIPSLQLQQQAVSTPVGLEEPAAALLEEDPSTEPAAAAVVGDTGSLDGSTGVGAEPCASNIAASLQHAAADADRAAQLAEGPQPDVLPRGAGMLVLCNDNWAGKALQLQAGRALVVEQHSVCGTHYSVVQLMSASGVLLQHRSAQTVQVRVAAEFLSTGLQL